MPIPVNPDFFLAMVILNPDAGNPAERFINTFFFRNDGGPGTTPAGAINTRLETFYNGRSGTQVEPVRLYLADWLPRAVEVRVYDLGQAAPRTPTTFRWNMGGPSGQANLPTETSIVCSLIADGMPKTRPSVTNPKVRSRVRSGRIYLGPLNFAVLGALAVPGERPRVADPVIANLTAALKGLQSTSVTSPVSWHLYSRQLNVFHRISRGFVNNDFDTQRRRGSENPAKTTWVGA